MGGFYVRIKRFLSVLLSMLMVCSIFGGLSVSAHSNYDSDVHTYTVVGDASFDKGKTSAVTSLGGIYTGPTDGSASTRYFFAMPADWYTFANATACAYWWDGTDKNEDWQHSYQMRSTSIAKEDGTRVYYIDAPADVKVMVINNGIDGGSKPAEGEEPSPNWGKNVLTKDVNLEGYDAGESDAYPDGVASFANMVYVIDTNQKGVNPLSDATTYGGEWNYLHADGSWDYTAGTTFEVKDPTAVLNKKTASVNVGKTLTIKATYLYADNAEKTWASSNESVATVDQNGVVTGKAKGTATISLTVNNPGEAECLVVTCNVTVKQPVTNIKLNVTDKNIYTGDTFTLKATAYPSNASNKKISFASDNTKIATVTPSGLVKGIKPGATVIAAESTDGGYIFAICKVVVKEKAIANKIVVASSFNKYFDDKSFNLGAKAKTKLNYKSSNKKVVTVSSNGKVTIKGIGKATITLSAVATSKYKSAIKKVTVNIKLKPINSKSVKIQKINNSTVKLSWSKVNSVNGYSVKIVSSASGRKNTAEAVLKKTSVKLVNVKKGQKLEILIRTYKKVGNKNYYSSWIKETITIK